MFEPGADLEVVNLEVDEPHDREITVRLAASGICHSDLTTQDGTLARLPCPMVLGHEGAGVVEAIGPKVERVAVGDHVVLASAPKCGECFYCRRGQPTLCETIRLLRTGGLLDGTTRLAYGSVSIHQLSFTGTFSERAVVPDIAATKIPDEVPLIGAALLGCAVVTGYGAATRTAHIEKGDAVAVAGCGGVGLSAILGARAAGATTVVAVDLNPDALELAHALGATDCVLAGTDATVRDVRARTSGRGVDVGIEASGALHSATDMLEMTRPGGEVVFVGMPGRGTIPLDLQRAVISGQRTLRGCVYGGVDIDIDVPLLASRYACGELPLDQLVTRTVRLSEINTAMSQLREGQLGRTLIVFD